MPRRRPSHGSYGVDNKRVGPPSASRSNNVDNRIRLVPHDDTSHASSVERWLTSPTFTKTKNDIRKGGSTPFDVQGQSRSMTKGHRLVSSSTASSSSSIELLQSQARRLDCLENEKTEEISQITHRRDAKQFTFDGFINKPDDDSLCHRREEIPAVVSDDSWNDFEGGSVEERFRFNQRPGMPSPVGNDRHTLPIQQPPPPPPPRPPPTKRPTNATPIVASVSLPPHHSQGKSNFQFIRRHTAVITNTSTDELNVGRNPAKDAKTRPMLINSDDRQEEGEDQTKKNRQHKPVLRRQISEGSSGFQQRSDSAFISSSVTKQRSVHDRNFSGLDKDDKPHCGSLGEGSNSSSVIHNHSWHLRSKVPSMRDLISLGSDGLSRSESRRDLTVQTEHNRLGNMNNNKCDLTLTPNSCSVTAATSGSVPTENTDSQDDVSQLTFAVTTMTTPQTHGITSHAETEKMKNPTAHERCKDGKLSRRLLSLQIRDNPDVEQKKIKQAPSDCSTMTLFHKQPDREVGEEAPPASTMTSISLRRKTNRIQLHVYDLVENDTQLVLFGCLFPLGQCFNAINSSLHSLGTGAYHVGIEINGVEYAYGASSMTGLTGVFSCVPKHSPGYQYRTTIDFGHRLTSRDLSVTLGPHQSSSTSVSVDGREVVRSMAAEYMGTDYDLLRKNCCTFAHDACIRLGVKEDEIPSWFHNLAAAGAVTQDAAHSTLAPITQALKYELDKFAEYINENGFDDAVEVIEEGSDAQDYEQHVRRSDRFRES